jgi:predicted ABC-type transport system involved in lysophospholipase L1 biosynthesis ATPase subunit
VNDRLEQSIDQLKAILLSERLRRSGRPLTNDEQAKVALADRNRLENMRTRIQPILDSFRDNPGHCQP